MGKPLKFFIVDDDLIFIKVLARYLESASHHVEFKTSSVDVLPEIIKKKPDCIILDIMMPEIDGFEMLRKLREVSDLNQTKIVMVTGKTYDFDRLRALDFGADGYITKPINQKTIVDQLVQIIENKILMTFWGIRGTLPVPGEKALRYGGNTSCVSLEFSRGNFFIFDAGSGIKDLSDHLKAENRILSQAKIFISHPHWDHINALPYFAPLYQQGLEFEICGPAHGDITMRELISGQMEGVYFPIKLKEFSARIYFRDLKEETINIDGITIQTMLLNHPGHCLGYRVEYNSKSVCYVTDNELYPATSSFYNENYRKRLMEFVRDTDVLVTDVTFGNHEYEQKIGWGHSSVKEVADFVDDAGVKTLYLFHHDPDQTDDDIDDKLASAQKRLTEKKSKTRCVAPKERECFKV